MNNVQKKRSVERPPKAKVTFAAKRAYLANSSAQLQIFGVNREPERTKPNWRNRLRSGGKKSGIIVPGAKKNRAFAPGVDRVAFGV